MELATLNSDVATPVLCKEPCSSGSAMHGQGETFPVNSLYPGGGGGGGEAMHAHGENGISGPLSLGQVPQYGECTICNACTQGKVRTIELRKA